MDQPGLDATVHRQALAGLSRVNAISRTVSVLWQGLYEVANLSRDEPLRVLDLGAGGGDVVIGLAQLARRCEVGLEVYGCDVSRTAIEHAATAARQAGVPEAQFFELDVLAGELPTDFDVLICTLFLHHFAERDALALLRGMATAARRGVLVDDLVRSHAGYLLAWFGGRLVTRSPLVHVDGPLSVRAAFQLTEIRRLVERAGLRGARIRPHWPQRYLMSWRKP
jgi:2-polyprenyl-3-methyl-5-hydroxy-6-metoxy-1,4-benzoquinol methylase